MTLKTAEQKLAAREYGKAYREANKEKLKQQKADYALKNKERISARKKAKYMAERPAFQEYNRDYYQRNSDAVKAAAAQYKERNKAAALELVRKWRAANPAKAAALTRAWLLRNRTRRTVYVNNRRARMVGKMSGDIVEKLLIRQKGKCVCCGQKLGDDFHLDHIVPLARGGLNVDANAQLLRSKCNLQKSARHPVEFMQSRGFLL